MDWRERIEEFIRRYWREGNRVLRVVAVAVAVLLALLLALRGLRVLRVVAVTAAIGAILVVAGWLLLGPLTIPRFSTEGPVVRNGVAVIVACGKKQGFRGMEAMDYAHEPRTGGWWPERRGDCTVWYHRPPGAEQRENRHQRAAQQSQRVEPPPSEREAEEPRFQGWGQNRCKPLEEIYLSTCRRLAGG
jgi:hypothetical protein